MAETVAKVSITTADGELIDIIEIDADTLKSITSGSSAGRTGFVLDIIEALSRLSRIARS